MRSDTRIFVKVGASILFVAIAGFTFYCGLFGGWASGTGPKDQPVLKLWSNVALSATGALLLASVAIWVLPPLLRKRRDIRHDEKS